MAGRWRDARRVAAAMALIAVLTGCAWRLETEPLPTPTADAAQVARDQAARNEAAIVAALGQPAAEGSGREALEALEALAAPTHLSVLGGVYEPYPDATPSRSPSPAPSRDAEVTLAPAPDLRATVITARDDAMALAFNSSESDEGFFAGSVTFTHAFALWYAGVLDARAAGVEVTAADPKALTLPVTAEVPLVPERTSLDPDAVAQLALRHDQARFTYEVIAARESGPARVAALQSARAHGDRAAALVTLSGIDLRTPVYELPQATIATAQDRLATQRLTEQGLGWAYMALTYGVDSTERAWLMAAAFDAYATSALMPGFTVAEFPVLPGATRD